MRRSTAAIGVGAVAFVGAWLFGSAALAPAAIGLVTIGVGARAWRRVTGASLTLDRTVRRERLVEGETLELEYAVRGGLSRWLRASTHESVGVLGQHTVSLRRGDGVLQLPAMPRGHHVVGPATIAIDDPFGLERAIVSTESLSTVLVRPRVADVDALFTDAGRDGFGGRRAAVRRSGVDLHSVRDYQRGEPLRLVHWPTTARRGVLTVLELQDAPRDETVVVLDCDPAGVVGPLGGSSFDAAVRACASIVRACAARGRRVALAGPTERGVPLVRVTGLDASWEAALDVLAAAEADAGRRLPVVLADPRLSGARLLDVVVVTCRPEGLAALPHGSALGGVVAVDAPTYAGAPPLGAMPELLRLASAGVPVAVLRQGDELADVISGGLGRARTA